MHERKCLEELTGRKSGDRNRAATSTGPMKRLGKFQLLERVGLGACGAVWRARDTELDRIVALKIPHAGLLYSPDDLERFRREAQAAAQLRHPNIVTVHDVVTLEGLPTLVSDFIEGVPLKEYMEKRRLTFREAAALIAVLADALEHAHRMGVVHRDIKPGNIMLERGPEVDSEGNEAGVQPGGKDELARVGKPLLMDFGLALRSEAEVMLTLEGYIIGTPAYMSPEQAAGKGHEADRRSDVYSLGVVLYELLCGELPFRGSKMMLVEQVLREDPRPPRQLNDRIPRDLETICLKCLAKDPLRRYDSAAELAADLRRWQAGELIVARPAGPVERLVKWAKRRPTAAALLGVSLLAVVILLVGGLWFIKRLAEAPDATETPARKEAADRKEADAERDRAPEAAANEARERERADQPQVLADPLKDADKKQFALARTSVRFSSERELYGMNVSWYTAGPDGQKVFCPPLEIPVRYNFTQAVIYRLKLSDIPGYPAQELYPTLEVFPANAKTATFLAHGSVPVTFTRENLRSVIEEGNYLVKVIYRPDPQFQDMADSGTVELNSTQREPRVDPIAEASKHGNILLVVRLGNVDLEMKHSPPMDAPPEGATPPPGQPSVTQPKTISPPYPMPSAPTRPGNRR